jgi:hypothetical protein
MNNLELLDQLLAKDVVPSILDGAKITNNPDNKDGVLFHDIVTFYNFVFDIGKTINPITASRELLKRDFALASPNYETGEVEIAARFRKLLTLRERIQYLSELNGILESKGLRNTITWSVMHPRRFTRILPLVLRSAIKPSTPISSQDESRTTKDILNDTLGFVDTAMTKLQLIEALQHLSDKELFNPVYLGEIPFTRVSLQPVFAKINGEDVSMDITLLLHRTGVAVLTFAVEYKLPKTVSELNHILHAGQSVLENWEVVKDVLVDQATAEGIKPARLRQSQIEIRYSSGVEWAKLNTTIRLTDLFEMHRTAIICTLHHKRPWNLKQLNSWVRTPSWFAYPIVFIRRTEPAYYGGEDFKKEHAKTLAKVLLRMEQAVELKPEIVKEIVSMDFALTDKNSYYVGQGHATMIYYQSVTDELVNQFGIDIPGQEWLYRYFQVSSLIEALLVQKWILFTIDSRISSLPDNLTNLNNLKKDLLFGLEEYHDIIFSFGSANEIIEKSRETLNVNSAYRGVTAKLDRIEKLIEIINTQRQARRGLFLNVAIAIVTVIASLPAIDTIVANLTKWKLLFLPADKTTQILYLIVTGIVLILLIWSIWPAIYRSRLISSDQSKPAKKARLTWPKKVRFLHDKTKK